MQPLVQPAQLIPKSLSSAPKAFGHLLAAGAATVQNWSSGNVRHGGAAAPAQTGLRCVGVPGCLGGAAVLPGQLLWMKKEELPSLPEGPGSPGWLGVVSASCSSNLP